MKSHKAPGLVVPRAVHSASSYAFEGLAKWVSHQFDTRVSTFSRIKRSGDEVANYFRQNAFPSTAWLYHFDLDDFFMTGSPQYLSKTCSGLVFLDRRALLYDVLFYLLSFQYVDCVADPDLLFAVVKGSGQGLMMSTAVADAAFLKDVELDNIGLTRSHFHRSIGIVGYLRYRDNLLFILENQSCVHDLQAALRRLGPFRGKIEEQGTDIGFLDMHVFQPEGFTLHGKFHTRPLFKRKGPTLRHDSCHPFRIHMSWPEAYIRRLWQRSATLSIFREARSIFIDRLADNFADQGFLRYLIRYSNFAVPYSQTKVSKEETCKEVDGTSWLVLDFHPAISKALSRAVTIVCSSEISRVCSQFGARAFNSRVRVSWRVSAQPFVSQFSVAS